MPLIGLVRDGPAQRRRPVEPDGGLPIERDFSNGELHVQHARPIDARTGARVGYFVQLFRHGERRPDHLPERQVSGEEVAYTYDQLGRLIAAATTGPEWGLAWVYDGFSNRLQQNVTKGTAPSAVFTVDAATNRLTGGGTA